MLGVLLRIVAQRLLAALVLFPRRAARLRAGDRTQLREAVGYAHEHLRRRADERALRRPQQEHVWRRVDRAQRAVERQRLRLRELRLPPLRDDDLEDLARG